MGATVVLICALLVLKVRGQIDTGTQSSAQYPSESYDTELDTIGQQTTPRNNYQLRKSGRLLNPQPDPRYLVPPPQPFGARIQQQNPGYESPFEQYSINWTNSEDPYIQPSEPVQYPQSGGYPQMMYYPPSLNYGMADSIRFSFQGDPIADLRNPALQNFRERLNMTTPEVSVYPEAPFARLNRRNRFPVPLVNVPNQNFFLPGDDGVRGPPFAPYPFQQMFYPQSIPTSDEDRVDIYVRPPYVDRESGSDIRENGPNNKELPTEQTTSPPGPTEVEVMTPAETIPTRYTPQRALTPNAFPFNIPPSELPNLPIAAPSTEVPAPQEPVPSRFLPSAFPYGSFPFGIPPVELVPPVIRAGDVPPSIPPPAVLPNFPPPVDENLLSSILSRPQPPPVQTVETGVLPGNLPAAESVPGEVETIPRTLEGAPIDEVGEIDTKIPYEFGYSMNDGLGTDQHRKEVSDGNGAVSGSYGYRDPFGVYRVVNYIADKNGFRAFIQSNEPGVSNTGSADVTVVAELPPPKALAEGLRTLNVNAVEVPDVPLETEPEDVEKQIV